MCESKPKHPLADGHTGYLVTYIEQVPYGQPSDGRGRISRQVAIRCAICDAQEGEHCQ
jgi:hypothetical protein